MGWRFPFVLNFAGSLFFLSSSTRAEEHGTFRTCEAAKRLQKVAIRVFGAVLHLKAAFVAAGRFVGGSIDSDWRWIWRASTPPVMRSRRNLDLVAAVSTEEGACSLSLLSLNLNSFVM
ncbi:BnaC08g02690D [Brassica napus]|uniref:(rape) hypothetical protein n=1 Tax=Brassica napus TaxID=3708 RepID=A0A078H5W5_BRANA|nr:unnamed protein product [Brassica napus]CDY32847.1 BnaC08g02690D [Brassica napus]